MKLEDHDERLKVVERKLDELDCKLQGLLDAWNTAHGVVRFVKWAAALVAALTTLFVSVSVAKDIALHNLHEALK